MARRKKVRKHCSHLGGCPGCPRHGTREVDPEAWASLAKLSKEGGLEPPLVERGAAFGFRYRARLATRGRPGNPKIGLFQRGTHQITDIPQCPLHHPLINRVVAALKEAIFETQISLYREAKHEGLLRYLQVVVERSTLKAQVVLVCNHDEPASIASLAESLRQLLGDDLHSLWWNGNSTPGNAILGDDWHLFFGAPAIKEQINGATVFFPPGAFGQSHLNLAERIVEQIGRWLPPRESILELYAGCGAIGLSLCQEREAFAFNEIAPSSLQGLKMGLEQIPERGHIQVLEGPAVEQVSQISRFQHVIVDPPRKGLERPLLQALIETPPESLIYVSCGRQAFLDEARSLLASEVFALRHLQLFDLFPYTEHVETLAYFSRR